jgi:S1-C subfamily serine protease
VSDRFDGYFSDRPSDPGETPVRRPVWVWAAAAAVAAAVLLAAAFAVGRWTAAEEDLQAVPIPVLTVPVTTSSTTTSSTTTTSTTTTSTTTTTTLPPVEPVAAIAAEVGPAVVQVVSDAGLGAGVIYDDEGSILTAAHVVEDDVDVEITLADGRRFDATVLGTHEPTDVAVISFDAPPGVPVAELAVGVELQVGQLAVALGSPFGLEQTVTAGIVSAVDRVVDGVVMVQTDAAINPGNSGGPLVDVEGRVIGINDQIFTNSGTNSGVGFAISVDLALMVADQIVAGDEVQLAFLGVLVGPGAADTPGALVESVTEGSAAEEAGIRAGDLIVAFDGRPIIGAEPLRVAVINRPPGTEVEVDLLRDGERMTLTVVLGAGG